MNERHHIYLRRQRGEPYPWTEDEILRTYKFTNVFRQLDRGTVHLTTQIETHSLSLDETLFNVLTYRMYNRVETQVYLGWIREWNEETKKRWLSAPSPAFTSAHMTVGKEFEDKKVTYARTWDEVWRDLPILTEYLKTSPTMEMAFKRLRAQKYFGIGPFIAYEIICDLRFTAIGWHWKDITTWANIGPGCRRGLQRLGLTPTVNSLRYLYKEALYNPHTIGPHIVCHSEFCLNPTPPPFELREIEHCLCEFDKYERARLGEGRPKAVYRRQQ